MATLNEYQPKEIFPNLIQTVENYFFEYNKQEIFEHSLEVAEAAKAIAADFNLNPTAAFEAGLLHDISGVIPNEKRLQIENALSYTILPAEKTLPMLLHQKQSSYLAKAFFNISNPAILNAIACHTTLKPSATPFDKCLFIADKIKWDRPQPPPYLTELEAALKKSLDAACIVYLDWLYANDLKIEHPWLKAAKEELIKA
ncbi:bis(5'-nucleosyl)-tetraphosphatase (symmetrical) YqeK [Enterococcus sp. LJL90]